LETPINLSTTVSEALQLCADSEYYIFAVLDPKEDDTLERKADLKKELEEILALVKLELLEEITHMYDHMIQHCRRDHGFGYRVMELTDAGILMFSNAKDRKVN
jgi:hypothetical protein